MSEAILGLGTNLGACIENLQSAIQALRHLPRTEVIKISNFYETVPYEVPNPQNNYLNCCVRLHTTLSPHTLLGACLGIEAAIGRERPYRFSPRIIDIDVLLYDNLIITSEDLILPHPRMRHRNFVLVPLSELCTDCKFYEFDFSKEYSRINFDEIKKLENFENVITA